MAQRRRGGSQIGTRYRTNVPQYDPTSGHSYRAAVTMEPDDAERAIAMAERAGLSISGFFNAVFKNAPFDPTTGLPLGVEPAEDDDALPFAKQEAS